MASTLTSPHLLLLLLCMTLFVSTTKTIDSNESTSRIVIKLIHRFSKRSPLYTPHDLPVMSFLEENAQEYLSPEFINLAGDYISVPLVQTTSRKLLLVNFSIGQPPIRQYAYMDTGSDLVWVDCSSSNSQKWYNYNPKRSTTYINVPCRSDLCKNLTGLCDSSSYCEYNKSYVSGQFSEGVFGIEQFQFPTSDDELAVLKVVFGCSRRMEGNFMNEESGVNGIFGLGNLFPSFVSQAKSNKFSYCIGNISDPDYEFNTLIFGEGIENMGQQIPINMSGARYLVAVEAISLQTSKFDIDIPVAIDTGAVFTYLEPKAYNELEHKVKALLHWFTIEYDINNRLCFVGNIATDLDGIYPTEITFHIQGNVEFTVSLFYQSTRSSELFCMTVVQSFHSNFNVIGILAQQNYYFSYHKIDNKTGTLTFQKMNCATLLD